MNAASVTQTNWKALKRLSFQFLSNLHDAYPQWNFADLQRHLDIPDTKLMRDLAELAGFEQTAALPVAVQNKVLRLMLHGYCSPGEIAKKTGASSHQVETFMREAMPKYGNGKYGSTQWGSPLEKAKIPTCAKIRRISSRGQISYRGRLRGLGAEYANRICWIEEREKTLLIHIAGMKSLEIAV